MAFTASIFMKTAIAEWHYLELCNVFHQWPRNKGKHKKKFIYTF